MLARALTMAASVLYRDVGCMRRTERRNSFRPTLWIAAVVGLSAVVGIWNAEDPLAGDCGDIPSENFSRAVASEAVDPTRLELMESTLAQAGCPGWMVLASEGEDALESPVPLPPVVPKVIQQTAHRESAKVPRVSYPSPVRVANRALFAPPGRGRAQLTTSDKDDPDDLLDGVPDLLAAPDSGGAVESAPAATAPAELAPAEAPPAEGDPPGNSPSAESDASAAAGPAFSAPAQEEVATPPASDWPAKPNEPAFAPPSKPLGGTPRVDVPPPPKKASPNKALPRETAPVAPPHPAPQSSPFSPPPKPKQATPHSTKKASEKKSPGESKTYCEFVAESQYPSAQVCAKCHEKIFDEWSVSSHAYASISPMFHKFEQKINDLSQGTIGYFCYRCHSPVGTTLGVSRAAPLWELPRVAREGVTCIACHRVNQRYGKVNGERRIEPGDIHAPVYGSIGGGGIAEVVAQKSKYKVKTSPHDKGPGQDIHIAGECFDQLGKSEFCVSCHQVAVQPGIKLEVVWEQYRASPACKKGVSCQDCHMGRIPGVPSGYEVGAAAKVGDKVVNKQRKHANHLFYGPGYSIAHPGIFPHNIDANRWSMQDWLLFDWRAKWGTEEFEELLEDGRIQASFPPVWKEADDRYDAREIIEDNLKKLDAKKISRQQVLENGSHVDGPFFDTQLVRGQDLKFHYIMTNTNDGHNLPSGSLGAQPQLWANVVLIGPRGQRLWESGYTDRWGDVADIHSEDVRNKRIPYDWQLFNLQTMFLITGAKGTDREFFLPVNIDIDQLAYLRPGAQPVSVLNHPPFIRMEGRSLAPLGSRKVPYKVPAELMCEPGHYRLSFRLRSRAEPIYFMRFCGSTTEMNRAMNEGMVDFHQSSIEFFVR